MTKVVFIGTPLVLFMLASMGIMVEAWDTCPPLMQNQAMEAAARLKWTKNHGTDVSAKGIRVGNHMRQVLEFIGESQQGDKDA